MSPPAPPRSTREAYRDLLVELMSSDEDLLCLDSDTGLFAGVDFRGAAARYVNLGIAEQNLVGVAAGAARRGMRPFVNTMATFASTRALEMVKIDLAYGRLPVRIAATHGGLSAGNLGPTHHSLEDLAIMRLLPGMTVVVPADAAATEELLHQTLGLPGPVYLRLGRQATPDLTGSATDTHRLGRARIVADGGDATVIAAGPHPVMAAQAARETLAAEHVDVGVLDMHTIKPLDEAAIVDAARRGPIVTVEEHWVAGGLGSAVAEVVASTSGGRVSRVGVADRFVSLAGGHEHLLAQAGVSADAVVQQVREALCRPGSPVP